MKTKEELNALKEEYKNMNKRLAELTEDELKQVVGGLGNHEYEFGTEQLLDRLGHATEQEKQVGQARLPAWDLIF